MDLKEVKKIVADDTRRIELHDLIADDLRKLLEAFNSEEFSDETKFSYEEFESRIKRCEELVKKLCKIQTLLGYWSSHKQINNYTYPIDTLSSAFKGSKENRGWKNVKWHPIRLLFYYGGITALAAKDYNKLFQLFNLRITDPKQTNKKISICESLVESTKRMDSLYNKLIQKPNHKTPLSEYLYHQINPVMDKIIYLGPKFESLFDRFEIMIALDYINRKNNEIPEKAWAPIGRFGFKQYGDNPFREFTEEAELLKEDWHLFKAGFFRGNYTCFQEIYTSFQDTFQRFQY